MVLPNLVSPSSAMVHQKPLGLERRYHRHGLSSHCLSHSQVGKVEEWTQKCVNVVVFQRLTTGPNPRRLSTDPVSHLRHLALLHQKTGGKDLV